MNDEIYEFPSMKHDYDFSTERAFALTSGTSWIYDS